MLAAGFSEQNPVFGQPRGLGVPERQGWGIGLRLDPGGHNKKPQMMYA
jgi:hypothetical protein